MDTLKETITSYTLYREMPVNVYEVSGTKDREYTGYQNDTKSYCFGNVRFHEDLGFRNSVDYCNLLFCTL